MSNAELLLYFQPISICSSYRLLNFNWWKLHSSKVWKSSSLSYSISNSSFNDSSIKTQSISNHYQLLHCHILIQANIFLFRLLQQFPTGLSASSFSYYMSAQIHFHLRRRKTKNVTMVYKLHLVGSPPIPLTLLSQGPHPHLCSQHLPLRQPHHFSNAPHICSPGCPKGPFHYLIHIFKQMPPSQ